MIRISRNISHNTLANTQRMVERGAVRGKNFSMRLGVMITVEHDAFSKKKIKSTYMDNKILPHCLAVPIGL